MSREQNNKAIVGRWFTEFWGATCNLNIVDELAAPDMLLQYSLHAPRRGREELASPSRLFFRDAPLVTNIAILALRRCYLRLLIHAMVAAEEGSDGTPALLKAITV
jgi:hypothetical protein